LQRRYLDAQLLNEKIGRDEPQAATKGGLIRQ
jgi:hypothetical protein